MRIRENTVAVDVDDDTLNLHELLTRYEQSKQNTFEENWIGSGRLVRSIAVPASLIFALQHLFGDPRNKNRNILVFLFSVFTYFARAAIVFIAPIFLGNALQSLVSNLANNNEKQNKNDIITFTVALFFMLPVNYFFTYLRSLTTFELDAKKDFKAMLMKLIVAHNNNLSLDAQVDESKEVMTTMIVRVAIAACFIVFQISGFLSASVASSVLLIAIMRRASPELKGLEAGKLLSFAFYLFYNSYALQKKQAAALDSQLRAILSLRAQSDKNKLIQLNGMEQLELAKSGEIINEYCERTHNAEHQDSINRVRVWLIIGVFSCPMAGYLLHQYTEGKFNLSEVVQLLFYLIFQGFELSDVSLNLDKLVASLVQYCTVNGYLLTPVEKRNSDDAVELNLSAAPTIEFNNVCFDYYRDLEIHCINSNETIGDDDDRMNDVRNGRAVFLIYDINTCGYLVGFVKPKTGSDGLCFAIEKMSMDANIEIGVYFSKTRGPFDDRSPFFGFVLRLLLPVIRENGGVIPKKHLIERLSFKVQAGIKTVIVGSSGCGKSTIINLLSRFCQPVSGEITINDIPIQKYTIESLRKLMAIISQDVKPFDATVGENILYGNDSVNINHALMQSVGFLPEFARKRAGQRNGFISGGQAQRTIVLHGLHKPGTHIVLADEPTNSLDDKTATQVQRTMNSEFAGKTVLQVSHNLLVTFCDELNDSRLARMTCVICFHDGEFEIGTIFDLINNPESEFFKLFKISCAESDASFDDITRTLRHDVSPSAIPGEPNMTPSAIPNEPSLM